MDPPEVGPPDRGDGSDSYPLELRIQQGCPGEFLTVDFVKDLLRKVWAEKIEFRRLNIADAKPLPVAPNMVVKDDIGFKKEQ